ncbi:SipW-dependent-type signal peptide-containing protein [Halobacteriaceae archaeon GCM10025711]
MTDKIQLSRRKVLAAMGAIGAGSALGGAGTMALFNDEEVFEGNQLTAGELDLKIDWQQTYYGPDGWVPVNAYPDHDKDGWQSTSGDNEYSMGNPLTLTCRDLGSGAELPEDVFDGPMGEQDHLVELTDVKPGDEGEITFSLHLCDNPGFLWMTLENILEDGGVTTEPEALEGEDLGELAENLYVEVWYDHDCDNKHDDGESVILGMGDGVHADDVTLAQVREELATMGGLIPLSNGALNGWNIPAGAESRECFEGGEQYCIGVRWWVPREVGNVIQGDTLSFDVGFYAEQCRHNDGCADRAVDLSTGVADWTVTDGPQTGTAVPQTAHNRWVDPEDDSCSWVAPPDDGGNTNANGDVDPVGTYRFETTFEVDLQETPAGSGPCRLLFDASTDNQATFYLDEVAEANELVQHDGPASNPTWSYQAVSTADAEITPGEHTLIALVENADDAGPGDNPVGLLVCGGVACDCRTDRA